MIQAFGLTSNSRKALVPAVDDVSFEARAGRVTVLLGASGAGKTTVLRLMLELQQGRGLTYFRGRPLHRIAHPSREVGVLLGDVPGHPARTVRGHLRMLCAAAGVPARRADEVLEVVGLVSLRDERLGTLSRGVDRRLGLACALLADPHTLVLDDPAAGLSGRESRWLFGMLRAHAAQGGTVLTTTADPKEAARTADRVVTLDRGRLAADQEAADFARTRLRPRVAVRTPHAVRLAALLTQEARAGRRSIEVVHEDDNRLSVYGSSCAHVGETAFRHGVLVHQLADETGDMGPGAGAAPTPSLSKRVEAGARHSGAGQPEPAPAGRTAVGVLAKGSDGPAASDGADMPENARNSAAVETRTPDRAPRRPSTAPHRPTELSSSDVRGAEAGGTRPGLAVPGEAAPPPNSPTPTATARTAAAPTATTPKATTPPTSTPSTTAPAKAASAATAPAADAPTTTTPTGTTNASPAGEPSAPSAKPGKTPIANAAVTVEERRPAAALVLPSARRTPGAFAPRVPEALPDLPPPISVRSAPSPLRPLRYELRRAAGIGTGFVTAAAVLLVSAVITLLLAHAGHTRQARLLAAWPVELPLPPAALGAGLLGALAFGDEFRHPALAVDRGTVPRRVGVLTAKLLVAGLTATLLAFLTVGCDAEVLYLVYGRELARVPADWMALSASWLALVVGCAWAGVLAAGVFRSTTAGLSAVLAVPVVVVPVVQQLVGSASVRTTAAMSLRLRETLLMQWPFGGERYLAAAARVIAQPVGGAMTLSLTALMCAYVVTTLRSRVR
ncbi:ATP-binding cassette domain-containing protein [Streptomyces hilarionis]|uniref:ATP-binding cassette domain-containing protein n=1 Tax=Streptomyces hilarionis TaxID=2839954 RepID=UPI002119E911|nr:ATP-binding cassette domain-containing protein [Streptomyces hilarionis]MCQ9130815.1 ATP-binding cassette domain-containing protein [Streptomyces hilarionis]